VDVHFACGTESWTRQWEKAKPSSRAGSSSPSGEHKGIFITIILKKWVVFKKTLIPWRCLGFLTGVEGFQGCPRRPSPTPLETTGHPKVPRSPPSQNDANSSCYFLLNLRIKANFCSLLRPSSKLETNLRDDGLSMHVCMNLLNEPNYVSWTGSQTP